MGPEPVNRFSNGRAPANGFAALRGDANEPPPAVAQDGSLGHEVAAILQFRLHAGRPQVLLRWEMMLSIILKIFRLDILDLPQLRMYIQIMNRTATTIKVLLFYVLFCIFNSVIQCLNHANVERYNSIGLSHKKLGIRV